MKKKLFIINAIILTATSLLLRTVGISFTIYISNIIGAEGMGLYQLILSIYALALTFASSGISIAVTRLVSEQIAKKRDVINVLKKSFSICLVISLGTALLLFLFADFVGNSWLRDNRTVLSLKVLALGLPFMALSSCMSGYFFAKRKAIKSASKQIIEQFLEILIVISIINIFIPKGLEYVCVALVIGISTAEIISCGYAYLLYRLEKNKEIRREKEKGIIKKIFKISLPLAASSYLRSIFFTLENILIPWGFLKFGASKESSLAQLGVIKGMAMPVLFFPSAFLSAFSGLLIPEIAEANALNQKNRVNYEISRVFQLTLILSILVTGIFLFFGEELSISIYKDKGVGFLLKILAPLIPLMYLDIVVDGMLKGLNQQVSSLKINIFDSLIRILLLYFLMPLLGIWGFIIVLSVSNILNPLLSIKKLIEVIDLRIDIANWIVKPVILVTASGFIVKTLFKIIFISLNVSIPIIIIIALYLMLLHIFGCITKDDIEWAKSIFNKTPEYEET